MNQELLLKYISGKASQEEKEIVAIWIDADVENLKEFISLRKTYDALIWQDVDEFKKKSRKKIVLQPLSVWWSAAVLLIAVSSLSVFLMRHKGYSQDLIEYHIPTAEIRELILPDGTNVMLNSNSTLLYPNQFRGKTRSVYLIGEANFKVTPNVQQPFIVKANDFQITALGTEFNVSAYPDNDELIATLLEGSVSVEYDDLSSSVILKPNEQLLYNKQTKRSNVLLPRVDDVTAWQRGELIFSNMYLEDIFTHLERKFPYTLIYSVNSLKDNTYSFRFKKQATFEEVMKIIGQVVGNITYEIKENKCYIIKMN